MSYMIRNFIVGNVTGMAVNAALQYSFVNGGKPFDWMELCIAGTIAGVVGAVTWAAERARDAQLSVTAGQPESRMGEVVRGAP